MTKFSSLIATISLLVGCTDVANLGNEYLRNMPRSAPPGESFNDNTAGTNLVGTMLRAAVGNYLCTYLSEKIWQPFGMESGAYWVLSEQGKANYGYSMQ